jgi:hypothetical protein
LQRKALVVDWSNEEHVRVYTRDSEEWIALPWEARAVFLEIVRKLDSTGRLELRKGRRGLAALIRYPIEVVDRGVGGLVGDGYIIESDDGYFVPSHEESQNATQSDKLRAKRSRSRRSSSRTAVTRDDIGGISGDSVTLRDDVSKDEFVTDRHEESTKPDLLVTKGDDLQQTSVPTPGIAHLRSLSLSVSPFPELPDPSKILGAESGARAIVVAPDQRMRLNYEAWQYASRKHAELKASGISPNAPKFPAMPCGAPMGHLAKRTAELLARSDPPDYSEALADMKRRVDVAAAEAAREPRSLRYFTPMTMWGEDPFWYAMGISPEEAAEPRQRYGPRGSRDQQADAPRQIKTLA